MSASSRGAPHGPIVNSAQAGIQNLRSSGSCEDRRVWIPAFAGMTAEISIL